VIMAKNRASVVVRGRFISRSQGTRRSARGVPGNGVLRRDRDDVVDAGRGLALGGDPQAGLQAR
jgi:hypothetical protein